MTFCRPAVCNLYVARFPLQVNVPASNGIDKPEDYQSYERPDSIVSGLATKRCIAVTLLLLGTCISCMIPGEPTNVKITTRNGQLSTSRTGLDFTDRRILAKIFVRQVPLVLDIAVTGGRTPGNVLQMFDHTRGLIR